MKEQKFIIKNMTCNSCVELVENELKVLGIKKASVKLGEVKIIKDKKVNEVSIRKVLQKHGFDIVNNYEKEMVENIRLSILELVNGTIGIEKELKFTIY